MPKSSYIFDVTLVTNANMLKDPTGLGTTPLAVLCTEMQEPVEFQESISLPLALPKLLLHVDQEIFFRLPGP